MNAGMLTRSLRHLLLVRTLCRSQSMLQLGTGRLVLADQAQHDARDIEPCEGMLEVRHPSTALVKLVMEDT